MSFIDKFRKNPNVVPKVLIEERDITDEIIEDAKELSEKLQSRTSHAVLFNTLNFLLETTCYLLFVLSIVAAMMLIQIAPFDVLEDMLAHAEVKKILKTQRIQDLILSIQVLFVLFGVAMFVIGRLLSKVRRNNNLNLNLARIVNSLQKKLSK